jgi:CheY-like chemotaxis protein
MNATHRPGVLLVDDKEPNLVALQALLEALPCEPVLARSGNEALRLLLNQDFALMLLDVQMPGMDGYEVAQHARSDPKTREVPIIFVTAMTERIENELRGYGSGAVDYLFKPVNPHILTSKVRVFLELERRKRELEDEVASHRRTLAALEQSNASLYHFTHAASHDLSAPLRAVSGFLDALDSEAGASLEAAPAEYLRRARRAADRMTALLESLLAFAGLQKELPFATVDLGELAEQVRADLEPRLAATGGEIEIAPLCEVNGVRARLYQLFLNLIGNALKFSRPGEPPRVRVLPRERRRRAGRVRARQRPRCRPGRSRAHLQSVPARPRAERRRGQRPRARDRAPDRRAASRPHLGALGGGGGLDVLLHARALKAAPGASLDLVVDRRHEHAGASGRAELARVARFEPLRRWSPGWSVLSSTNSTPSSLRSASTPP